MGGNMSGMPVDNMEKNMSHMGGNMTGHVGGHINGHMGGNMPGHMGGQMNGHMGGHNMMDMSHTSGHTMGVRDEVILDMFMILLETQ